MADQRQITSDAWTCVTKFKRLDDKGNLQDYWKCHYCQEVKTGNVGRVEAHLGNVPNFGIAGCKGNVPADVRVRMAQAANQKRENKKRKCISEQASGMTTLGMSSQIPNLGATNGSDEIYPGDAELGGSNPQGSTGSPYYIIGGGNDFGMGGSRAAGSQDAEADEFILWDEPLDHQQQIDGAIENLTTSVAVDGEDWHHYISDFGSGSSLNPNGEAGSNSRSSAHQQPPPNAVRVAINNTGASFQTSNFCGITAGQKGAEAGGSNSIPALSKYMSELRLWWMEHTRAMIQLIERELGVKRQLKDHLEWINSNITTGQMKISEWLKQVGQMKERSRCLFKNLTEPMSAENAMQLLQMIMGLTKEAKELIEQSREFDAVAMNIVLEFMNCRLEKTFKDHLRETLPLLLA